MTRRKFKCYTTPTQIPIITEQIIGYLRLGCAHAALSSMKSLMSLWKHEPSNYTGGRVIEIMRELYSENKQPTREWKMD